MTHAKNTFSRRRFLKIVGLGAAAGMAFKLGTKHPTPPATALQKTRVLMGTLVNLTLLGAAPDVAQAASNATMARMTTLEAQLSHFRADSQLTQLNRDGYLDAAGEPLLELLKQARHISELSNGAFDVTIKPLVDLYRQHKTTGAMPPAAAIQTALALVDYRQVIITGRQITLAQPGMTITLDSIAKGYIVDQGIAELKAHGFTDVLLEAGGDLLAAGQKEAFSPWQIGVQSPRASHPGLLTSFEVTDKAVATSGDYQQPFSADMRQHHILDPRSGYSAPELASATITAPNAALADALATAVMVLGPKPGCELVNALPGCAAYLVSKNLEISRST